MRFYLFLICFLGYSFNIKAQSLACGAYHGLAIKTDGTLWGWGGNSYGQIGDGTTGMKLTPIQVGTSNDWKYISSSFIHNVAIKSNGTLWAWGYNGAGQLGDGTNTERHSPVQIGVSNDWQLVAVGDGHSTAIKIDGSLWAWGNNSVGQLGDGTTTMKSSLVQVGTSFNWKLVSVGGAHNLAIKLDGTLWAWGYNSEGQLGDGTTINRSSPIQIGASTDWISITTGNQHSFALKSDGSIWVWGNNSNGQLGIGNTTRLLVPTQVGTSSDWKSIEAGNYHNLAMKIDGTLWAWGYNGTGQLGDGSIINRLEPRQIGVNTTWGTIAAAAGLQTLLVQKDGSLWAWGANSDAQLGDGSKIDKIIPTNINFNLGSLILPVSLSYLNADVELYNTKVTWETSSEINNQQYIISHSINAKDFDLIETIPAFGSAHSYTYRHVDPIEGVNYYKLVQIDKDGQAKELGIRSVSFHLGDSKSALAYPNPVDKMLYIRLKKGVFDIVEIRDSNGTLYLKKNIESQASDVSLDLTSLSAGFFTLHLSGSEHMVKKIIKK